MARQMMCAVLVLGFAALAGCDNPFPPGALVLGMFGGDNAGLMADDTSAHVHIGCTYGDIHEPIVLDLNSRFDVSGEQNINAYPISLGILHPARFTGSIDGRTMTLTVTLTDTAVTLGPVSMTFEKEPNLGPCPICFGSRARARRFRLTPL
jgi:hypothetical protein